MTSLLAPRTTPVVKLCALLLLLLAAQIPGVAAARTWTILNDGTGDAPTIQAGVDSAAVGDTVLVHPGTYFETVTFRGRDIVLRSKDGPESTIIDGSQSGEFPNVVLFENQESRAARLEGFTITQGNKGVVILSAEPSIVGNVISNNRDGGLRCGLFSALTEFSPLIEDNDIIDNTENFSGGGIFIADVHPHIINNRILRNRAESGDGGGINWGRGSQVGGAIIGNVIADNFAADHGGGLVVGFFNQPGVQIEIAYNVIARNRADGFEGTGESGGGMIIGCTEGWIHHNTIVENEGLGPSSEYGGGVVIINSTGSQDTSPLFEQNIIAFSSAGGGIQCTGGATPILRDNLAWQNVGGDGVGECPLWWQTNNNVAADPAFCDLLGGDYSVASNSPALTHPMGPLGAITPPGCGPTAVEPTTWGRIKARFQ